MDVRKRKKKRERDFLLSNKNKLVSGELPADIMRTKKSELRLYCDLLMQQVHSVKQSITQKGGGDQISVPDVEVMFFHS